MKKPYYPFREVILTRASVCTGCRACEVSCGFHHTAKMDPNSASIHIEKDEIRGGFHIFIDESCDICKELELPACIQICIPRALSLGRKFIK